MKAFYIASLVLLCAAIATATQFPTFASLTLDQSFCEQNEERPANKEACKGQELGKLMPYPGNCSQFLVCNCVYPTVKVCPGELWFNPETETCDWPINVRSCNNGGGATDVTTKPTQPTGPTQPTRPTGPTQPTEPCDLPPGLSVNNCQHRPDGTLQRYPYNCNAYINCTQGCSVLNYCIPGKVFNILLMICDTPDTAKCIELELPTSTTAQITITTEEITTSTESVTHPTTAVCEPLVGVSTDICDFTEEYGELQRYPYDCKAYINCTSGCPLLDYCEPGKVFNEILFICDTPSDEYCREEQLPTTSAAMTTMLTTLTPTQSPTLPPDFNNEICCDRPNGALLPYVHDCSKFIVCVNKKPTLQSCAAGWLFNPELLICDEPRDVKCYDGQTTTTTTLQPTTSTPIYESCVGQPYGTSYPDIDNCQRYYFCWGNGTSSILHCPFENWYNPDTGDCGPEVSPVACRRASATTTTLPTPTVNVCENQLAGTSLPDTSNCEQYIYCLGGGASTVLQCPSNNYFNPATGNCGRGVSPTACREEVTSSTITTTPTTTTTVSVSTTLAPPQQGNDICANRSSGELLPYPGSCNKYIVCTKLAPIAFTCPNNWQFNPATKSCDFPENVKCGQGEVTTTPAPKWNVCQGAERGVNKPYKNNCHFYIECLGSDLWMLNSCMWGEYFDPSTLQCSADVASNACQTDATTISTPSTAVTEPITTPPKHKSPCYGKPPGEKIAYPQNCTKYIVCQSPIPVGYACDADLEFSEELQKCVNPNEANCSIKTTIATTERTTTTTGGGGYPGPDCKNSEPGATYPFRSDCSKYIICVDGLPQIVPCMPNTYYNLEKRRCDCNTSPTACFGNVETTTEGATTATTPERSTETSTQATEITPTENTPTTENPMGPCDGEPDGMLVPYPYNCSKYIICLSPIAIGYDCPLGLDFNAHLKQCDLPKDANCQWTTATTSSPNTTPLTTTTPSENTPDCSKSGNGAALPYPADCSQYIICIDGQATTVRCMPGTYYNPAKGSCDSHTSETACRETGTTVTGTTEIKTTATETTVTTPTTQTTHTTSTEASTTSTDTTTITTSSTTTTRNPNTPNVCCGKPLGSVIAYPGKCDHYIYCEYPVPITVRCANNYIFDMSLLCCVPMEQGQCQDYQLHDDV